MITPDVSESSRQSLECYYRLVQIDYITYKCPPMITTRQNQMYGNWINYAFTKWQCLSLYEYEKIIYLDADHLVVKNIDHLFELNAPALCFTDENYGYYDKITFGQTITTKMMSNYFKFNKILCKGGTVLFKPDLFLYRTIKSLLNSSNRCLTKNRYHNGYDEQILLQAMIKLNMNVTQLSVLYVWNAGSYQRLNKNIEPYVINYYGDKKNFTILFY